MQTLQYMPLAHPRVREVAPPPARPRLCALSSTRAAPARFGRGGAAARRVRAAAAPAQHRTVDSVRGEQVCVVLGTQWGDEGKGKLVDILAKEYQMVARAQGGANAGHTIYDDAGNKYALHLVPSGILNQGAQCVVGNGVVMHAPGFFEEVDKLQAKGVQCEGRIAISDRAHLLFDLHKEVDGAREAELAGSMIGTTKRGIGPCYASKSTRNGIRVGELRHPEQFAEKFRALCADAMKRFPDIEYDVEAELARYTGPLKDRLLPYVTDSVALVNGAYNRGDKILVEGANATMLDIDFGTYPFVTSSNPSIGGIITGLGLAPQKLGAIIAVAKAYTTRVGSGPYPTEIFGDLAEELRAAGYEYGTTTGRPRRIGWLDVPALRYACDVNGITCVNLTKLDVLSGQDEIKLGVGYKLDGAEVAVPPACVQDLERVEVVYETMPGWKDDISKCRSFADLPPAAQKYVERCEELLGLPIVWIGVGPGRQDMALKEA
ncbi:unnamed protein product [Pedinophyceae sp. YPF-701]|nr:unnamed protein product [Pedinophyceae sp. YPF-701]